jgi:AhpD family alkylhydroperoxidase
MSQRFDPQQTAKEPLASMFAIENYLAKCEPGVWLLHLVKARASQINGCAYCIDMHTKDARAAGETEQRLYALSTWRETPFFTDRERAAFAWTEAVTLISGGVPDTAFDEANKCFNERELVDLTWAAVAINAWNRIAINSRAIPAGA